MNHMKEGQEWEPSPEVKREALIDKMAHSFMEETGCSYEDATRAIRKLFKEQDERLKNDQESTEQEE